MAYIAMGIIGGSVPTAKRATAKDWKLNNDVKVLLDKAEAMRLVRKKFTAPELAARLGIPVSTVSPWYRMDARYPSMKSFKAIKAILEREGATNA